MMSCGLLTSSKEPGVPGPGLPCGTGTWSCWCITRSHTNPARCWRPGCPEPSQAP
ncbi:unnamed protein product [Natator depressus]